MTGARAQSGPVAIAVGDPAGVGPEVSVRAALACMDDEVFALFGDASRLGGMLRVAGGSASQVRRVGFHELASLEPGQVGLVHVADWDDAVVRARAPTPDGGRVQLAALDAAIAAVREGTARCLVTGPTSKEAIHGAGFAFVGQTEYVAQAAGLPSDAVTMMFLGPRLRVALATTHLAVRTVPDALSSVRIARATEHLVEALHCLEPDRRETPRVIVAALNPHAGEGGLFGDEERLVIEPAVHAARGRLGGRARIDGPVAAETALRQAAAGEVHGVVTMMHDQATIASKLLDWSEAVNVTWGLPFVRTSVDHGVAYAAAAAGEADPRSMQAAIRMAERLSKGPEGPGP